MINFPIKILIVEDDNLLATRLERDLKNEGFEVTQIVENLPDAVSSVKKQTPDLALIDIKLSGPEDGILTARELRKIVDLPIIYITGETSYLDAAKRSETTYPAAFLEKPIRTKELIVQVNLAINNFQAGNLPIPESIKSDFVLLFVGKEYVNVRQSQILFLEAEGPYTKVYITSEEHKRLYPEKKHAFMHASPNLGRIHTGLRSFFYKISRGIIVNVSHITRLTSDEITIGSHKIPIPEGRGSEFINSLNVIKNR